MSRSTSRPAFAPDSCVVAEIMPSPNHGERSGGRQPDMIVLHYTGMPDAESALALLCAAGSNVSAHYFVFEDGRIVQMDPESRRAWHAGQSEWAGETDINSWHAYLPGYAWRDRNRNRQAGARSRLSGFFETPDRRSNGALPEHPDPQHNFPGPRLGPFGRCAGAQAGSGGEIHLAHAL